MGTRPKPARQARAGNRKLAGAALIGALIVLLFMVSAIANVGQVYEMVGPLGLLGLGVTAIGLVMIAMTVSAQGRALIEQVVGRIPHAPGLTASGTRRLTVAGALAVLVGLGLLVTALIGSSDESAGPSLRASESTSTNGSPLLKIPKPVAVEKGDVLIAQLHGRGPSSFRAPAGWNQIGLAKGAGDTVVAFWRVAGESEPAVYQFEAQHSDGKGGGITAWAGIDPVNPIADVSDLGVLGKSQGAVPGVAIPGSRAPVILMVGAVGPTSIDFPADMTVAWSVDSPNGEYISTTACATVIEAGPTTSGDKVVRVGEADGFGGWAALLVGLRPDGSA